MNAQALTAVGVQRLLREADAELARGKPTAETLCRLLALLSAAYRPGFYDVSITSPLTGKRVLLAQLVYRLVSDLEETEASEHDSRRAG